MQTKSIAQSSLKHLINISLISRCVLFRAVLLILLVSWAFRTVARIQFIGSGQFGEVSLLLIVTAIIEAFVLMGSFGQKEETR